MVVGLGGGSYDGSIGIHRRRSRLFTEFLIGTPIGPEGILDISIEWIEHTPSQRHQFPIVMSIWGSNI